MLPYGVERFDNEICRPFEHKGNRNGILLIHGFTASCAQMRKLAELLAADGFTVRSINLPGHATTEDDMAKVCWKDWLNYSMNAVTELRKEVDTLTVCGLSMGGVLSLLIAQQMDVDACVPISAPMGVKNKLLALAPIASLFMRRVEWGEDPDREKSVDAQFDIGYSGFPTAKGGDLYKLIRMARKNLSKIKCPLLCIQSDADETISDDSLNVIIGGVSSDDKRELWLHGLPHVCILSPELPDVESKIRDLMLSVAK